MTERAPTPQLEKRVPDLTATVNRTLEQCRRFQRIAAACHRYATRWPTDGLARRLNTGGLERLDRHLALVALALQASAASGRAIIDYDPGDDPDDRLFYRVVITEWEQRYGDDIDAPRETTA